MRCLHGVNLLLAAVLGSFSSGTTFAGVDADSISGASADVNFASPGTVNFTLEAYPSPGAGEIKEAMTLARGEVLTGAGNTAAVRWSPETGEGWPGDNDGYRRIIRGDSNVQNQLVVLISPNCSCVTPDGQGWLVEKKSHPDNPGNIYFSVRTPADLVQTVAEDTYTLSLDAAAWRD